MRTTALLLVLTLPSFGFAQSVTSPAYPQVDQTADAPVAARLVPSEVPAQVVLTPAPLYTRWYVWAGVGATVTAIVVASVVFAVSSQGPHPVTAKDICGGSACDACIGFSCR